MNTYAIVGLGYVGLGLAVALGQKHKVFGYDINQYRIRELSENIDRNEQVSTDELSSSDVTYTSDIHDIRSANFYIVTVSTPAYFYETPNLEPLIDATKTLASIIKKGDIIVYESTVYPGTTMNICVPILEQHSHMTHGVDFHVGYSPERINPGDTVHTLKTITKVLSAANEETLATIKETYQSICDTVYPVSSIEVAEAIKILENTQRDVNIAMMNEFTKIMHSMNLNTHEIIEGAKTKWGFLHFKPGLVGGHCISIDPHYLAFEAKRHAVYPDLILTARQVNDGMTQFIIQSMLKLLLKHNINTADLSVGVFGISYKENTVDTRNSLALKLIKELKQYGANCHVHDPYSSIEVQKTHGITLETFDKIHDLSVAIIAVGHEFYEKNLPNILEKCKKPSIIMDIPNLYVDTHNPSQDMIYWSL